MASTTAIPSICLPRIYFQFDEDYVAGVFNAMFGTDINGNSCVDHIDFLGRQDRNTGEPYWLCFVHFSNDGFTSTPEIENYVKRINNGEVVNIQYDYPKKWYWKSSKNNKPNGQTASPDKKLGPRIMPQEDQDELDKNKTNIKKEQKTETKKKMNWADVEEEEDMNAGD